MFYIEKWKPLIVIKIIIMIIIETNFMLLTRYNVARQILQPSILPIQMLRIGQMVILSVPGGNIHTYI